MSGPGVSQPDSNTNSHTGCVASVGGDAIVSRRHLLSGFIGGMALLSGCSDLINSNGTDTPSTSAASPTANGTENGSRTATATPTPTKTTLTDSDLRLETYTNSEYGYRVQYPAEWSVDDSAPTETAFRANDNMAVLEVRVPGSSGQNETLDQAVETALSATRSRMDDVEVLDEQAVTLESGEPARVSQIRYDNPNDSAGMIRSTYLVTLVKGLVYELEFAMEDAEHTEADEQLATAIINSYELTGQQPDESQTTETETNDTDGLPPLTTYTNDVYGYRVQYPTGWSVDDSAPTETIFRRDDNTPALETRIRSASNNVTTLDELVKIAHSSTRSRMDDVEVLNEQSVTLESGDPAHVIQFRYDNPSDSGGALRTTYLVTLTEGLAYEAEFVREGTEYTGQEERLAAAIVSSYALTG